MDNQTKTELLFTQEELERVTAERDQLNEHLNAIRMAFATLAYEYNVRIKQVLEMRPKKLKQLDLFEGAEQ